MKVLKKLAAAILVIAFATCLGLLWRELKATTPQTDANPENKPFTVELQARVEGADVWVTDYLDARPGDMVEFIAEFRNVSEDTLSSVHVGVSGEIAGSLDVNTLSPEEILSILAEHSEEGYLAFVSGTTVLTNGSNPGGANAPNTIINPEGLDIGGYTGYQVTDSGEKRCANAYVQFKLIVGPEAPAEGTVSLWAKCTELTDIESSTIILRLGTDNPDGTNDGTVKDLTPSSEGTDQSTDNETGEANSATVTSPV